jgi:hypothetical protein
MSVDGNWKPIQESRLHMAEMMRRAERQRLAREALAGQHPVIVRIYAPVLSYVGGGLVRWGTQLQQRYGEVPAVPPMQMQRKAQ